MKKDQKYMNFVRDDELMPVPEIPCAGSKKDAAEESFVLDGQICF